MNQKILKQYQYATDELYSFSREIFDEHWKYKPFRDIPIVDKDGNIIPSTETKWGEFKEEVEYIWENMFVGNLKSFKNKIKRFFQRRTRGWDDSDTWSLAYSTAKFMIPRLERFKQLNNGHPGDLTEEKWDEIINEIIWYLNVVCNEDDWEDRMSSVYLAIMILNDPIKDLGREISKQEKDNLRLLVLAEEELQKQYDKAEHYFGKYFTNLWW